MTATIHQAGDIPQAPVPYFIPAPLAHLFAGVPEEILRRCDEIDARWLAHLAASMDAVMEASGYHRAPF